MRRAFRLASFSLGHLAGVHYFQREVPDPMERHSNAENEPPVQVGTGGYSWPIVSHLEGCPLFCKRDDLLQLIADVLVMLLGPQHDAHGIRLYLGLVCCARQILQVR